MLSTHPQSWPLLETYLFSRRIGLGALLRSVPPSQARERADRLPDAGLGRIFSRSELVAELREISLRWLSGASAPGTRFIVDKSPWHLSDLDLIAEVLPEARFVHVVRDGRDVAVSLAAARRTWSSAGPSSRPAVIREAGELWARGLEAGERAQVALGERLLEVRYEQVRADPAAALRELFEHCGMPCDEPLIEAGVAATDIARVAGGSGEDRAVRSGRIGEWRESFGLRDRWTFERAAGPTLRASGYEPDPRWWLRRPFATRAG